MVNLRLCTASKACLRITALRRIAAFFLSTMVTQFGWAEQVSNQFSYSSSVSEDGNGPLDLFAELNYDSARDDAPIAVVMHGYSPTTGNFSNVRANAQRLRDAGFFAISVAMRGRDGSDGVRDSGGVEIYDIYDAVEAVKSAYPDLVDETNIHITGYSGGGGNTMSALTKFPDYFRLGSSYFGISDYGFDQSSGWYFNGAASNHQSRLRADIGNPTLDSPIIEDRYHARASNLASKNNPYSEIHLFVNSNEPTCPPVNVTSYRDNAVSAAVTEGEFDNIHLHIPSTSGTYEDFNGNGVNDSGEMQWWPHGFPDADEQHAAESWYLDRLLAGSIPEPVLNTEDELFVAGFVKTKKFELWLGDGANAAGQMQYSLSPTEKSFSLQILSNNRGIETQLSVDTSDMQGQEVDVLLNGMHVESLSISDEYQSTSLRHNDTLLLRLAKEGDYDRDGTVGLKDYEYWRSTFGSTVDLLADGNKDGIVDLVDYTIWRNNFGTSGVAVPTTNVPEPAALLLAATAVFTHVFVCR